MMVDGSPRDRANAVIRDRFQQFVPRAILLHERVADEVGLSGVELQALHLLALASGPLSPSELSRQAELPRSTITRALASLEESGYVTRTTVAGDGRRALIHVVPSATAELSAKFDVYARAMEEVGKLFSDDQLEVVGRYWDAFNQAITQPELETRGRTDRADRGAQRGLEADEEASLLR